MAKMTQVEKNLRNARRKAEEDLAHLISSMASDKKRESEQNTPEPPMVHAVGDEVFYGAWVWTGILEVFENGQYYKCFSVTKKPKRHGYSSVFYKIHFESWTNLKPYRCNEEIDSIERLERDNDIHLNYSQRDMISLLHLSFSSYGVDLDPEYQRGNVWTPEQKVALIDSIFHNVDIGKFAIIKRPWGPNKNVPITQKLYEMLDGKQRLTALVEFFTGQFSYKGKYYFELHPRDQSHFTRYSVSWAETADLTKEQKYRYFLKLNTTGTPVDPKHMEKVADMLAKERTL